MNEEKAVRIGFVKAAMLQCEYEWRSKEADIPHAALGAALGLGVGTLGGLVEYGEPDPITKKKKNLRGLSMLAGGLGGAALGSRFGNETPAPNPGVGGGVYSTVDPRLLSPSEDNYSVIQGMNATQARLKEEAEAQLRATGDEPTAPPSPESGNSTNVSGQLHTPPAYSDYDWSKDPDYNHIAGDSAAHDAEKLRQDSKTYNLALRDKLQRQDSDLTDVPVIRQQREEREKQKQLATEEHNRRVKEKEELQRRQKEERTKMVEGNKQPSITESLNSYLNSSLTGDPEVDRQTMRDSQFNLMKARPELWNDRWKGDDSFAKEFKLNIFNRDLAAARENDRQRAEYEAHIAKHKEQDRLNKSNKQPSVTETLPRYQPR
jgi:hypothetical protein